MAVRTFFLKDVAVNGFGSLSETNPGSTTTNTGWVVAKTSNLNFSKLLYGTERSGAFSTTDALATAAVPASGDSWRSENIIDGVFANANWTLTFAVRAVSSASSQTGRVKVRLWRGTNAAGTGATQITSGMLTGTTTAALSTSADATSVVTFTPGATITLNGEYLFVQCEWEIVVASGANQGDVDFRAGASTVVTSNFTAATDAFTGNNIAVAAPVIGAPTFVRIINFTAANLAVSSPVLDTVALGGAAPPTDLAADNQATDSPSLEALPVFTSIAANQTVSAANLAVGSPVIGVGTFTQKHSLAAAAFAVSSPVLDVGTFVQIRVFTAVNLAVSSPVLQSFRVIYNAVGNNLAPASPVIGAGTFSQKNVLGAGAFAVGSPVLGVGVSGGAVALNPANLAVASPVLGAGAFGQAHTLSAAALAVGPPVIAAGVGGGSLSVNSLAVASPVLGVGALSQKQILSAANLTVSSPVLDAGVGAGPPATQIILSAFAIDNGLDAFFNADQILVCSGVPTSYATAVSLKLGSKNFGPGGAFTTPQAGSPSGRKVTSTAVTDGGINTNGSAVCWTAIDSVNSQWLATGVFSGSGTVTSGQAFPHSMLSQST